MYLERKPTAQSPFTPSPNPANFNNKFTSHYNRVLSRAFDSKPAIKYLTKAQYKRQIHPIIIFIRNVLRYLMDIQKYRIDFIWVWGHLGIPGNELVHRLVCSTHEPTSSFLFISHSDIMTHLQKFHSPIWPNYSNKSSFSLFLLYFELELPPPPSHMVHQFSSIVSKIYNLYFVGFTLITLIYPPTLSLIHI